MAFSLQNKHALGLALGGFVALAAYVWATWEPSIPVPASARAPSVGAVQSVPGGPQTPEYERLQRMADNMRANRARETGGSAVPTPPQLQPLPAGEKPPTAPVGERPPATGADPMTAAFATAMQSQAKELIKFRERFEPKPTRMVAFEDIKGQRERAEEQQHAERLLAETRTQRPRDRRGLLQPGDILYAVLQTAINSDEPGPVRAKVVGERFKGAILLGGLSRFPPVVGSRPERVLVKFNYLTTPDRVTHAIDAYAIDTETARTALATGVDHHYLQRWGSLLAASFLEGYGDAVRASHSITTVGPLGNVVSVPKDDLDHEDIVREAVGTVGQRLGGVVAENFQRPNTITVDSGAGIGVLIVAPSTRNDERGTAGGLARLDRAGERATERSRVDRVGPFPADLPTRDDADPRATGSIARSRDIVPGDSTGSGRRGPVTRWGSTDAPTVPLTETSSPSAATE